MLFQIREPCEGDVISTVPLWVLGNKFLSPEFSNAAMARMMAHFAEEACLEALTAEYACGTTLEGSLLRPCGGDVTCRQSCQMRVWGGMKPCGGDTTRQDAALPTPSQLKITASQPPGSARNLTGFSNFALGTVEDAQSKACFNSYIDLAFEITGMNFGCGAFTRYSNNIINNELKETWDSERAKEYIKDAELVERLALQEIKLAFQTLLWAPLRTPGAKEYIKDAELVERLTGKFVQLIFNPKAARMTISVQRDLLRGARWTEVMAARVVARLTQERDE